MRLRSSYHRVIGRPRARGPSHMAATAGFENSIYCPSDGPHARKVPGQIGQLYLKTKNW